LFVDVQQIIPPPEAAEFMISMSSKESEEKTSKDVLKERHRLRLEFWEQCLQVFRERNIERFQNINPSKDHWLNAGSGVRSCPYTLIFAKRQARVQLELMRSDEEENDWIFQQLIERKTEIEGRFGSRLEWLPLAGRKSSRVQYARSFDGFDKAVWPEMIDWLATNVVKLENALGGPLARLNPSKRRSDEELPDAGLR
jgi:hypothetical protein